MSCACLCQHLSTCIKGGIGWSYDTQPRLGTMYGCENKMELSHSSPSLGSFHPLPGITPPPPWDHSTPSLGSLLPLPGITPPPPSDHSSPSLGSLLPLPGITPLPPWDPCMDVKIRCSYMFITPPLPGDHSNPFLGSPPSLPILGSLHSLPGITPPLPGITHIH